MKVRTIVTLATVAAVVTGCAKATTGPGAGGSPSEGIAHARGAGDLVIQVSNEGGFISPSYTLTQIPQFSLFGDGSVLMPGAVAEIYPGPALYPIQRQVVTEAGIQAILRAAIAAGLEDGKSYTDMVSTGIADASTTVFTFEADGLSHTVKVYALGELTQRRPDMSAQEFQARKTLAKFLSTLATLEKWLPDGSVGPSTPFRSTGARLFVSTYRPDAQLKERAVAWPLAPALARFGTSTGAMGIRCGVVSGHDWTSILLPLAARANQLTPWTSAGHRYAISFRPLLPNETAC